MVVKAVIISVLLTGWACAVAEPPEITPPVPPASPDNPWAKVPKQKLHTDHSTFFEGPFPDGPSVTRACRECHKDQAGHIMKTAHWNLEGDEVLVPGHDELTRIGKKNLINNFCIGISSNWPGCTSCHIGYGWEDENFDLSNPDLVDCVVCHDTSGTYKKQEGGAGRPDPEVDLLTVAKSVGLPSRVNCGSCHFQGGGGNAIKHGDMDDTLLFPSARIDIHMGKLDFACIDCHQAKEHLVPGRLLTVSVDRKNRLRCTDCHNQQPHPDTRLNAHTSRVACQTCHIPFMAVDEGTKLSWDWSEAGKDLDITDEHIYLKIKGRFTYAKGVPPEYYWYNETSSRYLLGDKIDPSVPTAMAAPLGNRSDPESKIYPFKVHRGKQIYDVANKYFILPHVHGDKGFWTAFDWPTAARIGAESAGLEFSGIYDFAPTEMFLPQNHMVTPSEKALQCRDCHGPTGRLDWLALGYASDPLGRPVLEHEEFMLLDADEEMVQYTEQPISTRTTCGQCHELFTAEFNATHGYHSKIDMESLTQERRQLLQQGPVTPSGPEDEMNCFLCHLKQPNHAERMHALQSDQADWSISATLLGTGLIDRTDDGYAWNQDALEEALVEPGTSYVSETNCGACHGAVAIDSDPLHVDIGSGKSWTTEKTGQIFSPQRIRLSGMNLKHKDELSRAWDVHSERLVQCGDCHYSKGRPERLVGKVSSDAVAKLGEQRRRCESCHSLSGTHRWLPDPLRHLKAVSCESCHVPKLYMSAQKTQDNTIVRLDGKPQVFYRGVEDGRISQPTNDYIEGYHPLVLIGENAEEEDKVIPYNLVTEWYWVDANGEKQVSTDILNAAWTTGNGYRKEILQAFDTDDDKSLSDQELRIDNAEKLKLIKDNLMALGIEKPQIRGEIRSYHIHHNVTHGDLVSRDCNTCHKTGRQRTFELSPYLPGNVLPQRITGEALILDSSWEVTDDGRLMFVRKQALADTYRSLQKYRRRQ